MYFSNKATNRLKVIATPVVILVLLLAVTTLAAGEYLADGGDVYTHVDGGDTYRVHVFLSDGTLTVNHAGEVDVLVVGGGGGGGAGGPNDCNNSYIPGGIYGGAGGGAGGLIWETDHSINTGNVSITVGNGGSGGTANGRGEDGGPSSFGEPSSFDSLKAFGGGGGGAYCTDNSIDRGGDGGSGGGNAMGNWCDHNTEAGSGTSGQGNDGVYLGGGGAEESGNTAWGVSSGTWQSGGHGSYFGNRLGSPPNKDIGDNGAFAGGGGGGAWDNFRTGWHQGLGGKGGGGNSAGSRNLDGVNGDKNTGGGGGGGGGHDGTNGGDGGSGIVVVRYKVIQAIDDTYTTNEDTHISIDSDEGVLTNDYVEAGPLTVTDTDTLTTNGQVNVMNPNGSFTYDPDGQFEHLAVGESAIDTFSYTAEDQNEETDSATVTISISGANDDPTAANDETATTSENSSAAIDVVSNDTDIDDTDLLSVDSVTDADHGKVTNNNDDTLTYTPDTDYNGKDTFSYTVSDGNGGTDNATVTVTVTGTNDPPVCNLVSITTDEDTQASVNQGCSDPEDDSLTYSVTQPTKGVATTNGNLSFDPDGEYETLDTGDTNMADGDFTYTASDGSESSEADVNVTVNGANEAPQAFGDSYTTAEDTQLSVSAPGVLSNDSDVDEGDTLDPVLQDGVSNGTLTLDDDGFFTYTPDTDFNGSDSFTYTASDGSDSSSTVTVDITVDPVNDAPTAVNDVDTTDEDTSVDVAVLENDTDPEDDGLTVDSVGGDTAPTDGSVSITNNGADVTYTPDENFQGMDTFTYTVSDGNGGTDSGKVQVTVDSTIDPPQADDDTATTDEDTPVTIDVLAKDTDPDGSLDASSVTVISESSNGTTSVDTSTGNITYTPDTDYNGEDSFTYQVADDDGAKDTAEVTITVNPVNDSPVAVDDTTITEEDTSVDVNLLANDSDPDDGDTLSVSSITQPANGQGINNDDGTLTYTPDTDYSGEDSFSYTVSDGNGGTDTATVTVTVSSVEDNTPPVAENRFVTTCNDESLTVILEATDPEIDSEQPEEHPIDFSIWSQPREGEVTGDLTDITYEEDHVATVEATYTPPEGFTGDDSFTYQVEDPTGAFDQAEVRVTVEKCEETTAGEAGAAGEVTDTTTDVAINEVAWAGTEASPDHEWIELFNNTESKIDLTGWIIRFKREEDESWKEITLTGTISPRGYYLLERISDDTVNVAADLIYDKEKPYELSLSDKGELVELLDGKGNVVDTANSRNTKKGWPAGSTKPVSSMERIDPAKADTGNNWDSNQGRITAGVDSDGHDLRSTPSKVNESYLLGRELHSHPRKIREGKVLSVLVRKPEGETNNFDALLASSAKVAAGGAGSLVKTDALSGGNSQALDKYHVVFDTSKVEPGKYRIFLMVDNEAIFQQYVQVVN